MGYDVYITRRENWWDQEGGYISTAEWEAAVEADPDLVMVPIPEGWQGSTEPVAETVPGKAAESRSEPLWWRAGRIAAKNPSDAMVTTMCQVAKVLDARVQGDDGEYYEDGVLIDDGTGSLK
ncbi:hypothetical protein GCM10018781_36570 [Kitasatospora indigofera]|uniref:Uncharacterized protein n=1 Tax=Kitasatospora indigofera TaxID=67307 RepID=A0A919FV64_9ACTN|nr:hypothetical protein [Kitasatospora indigofera]GHH73043.1 hypothetical protein GCM10018781_36570 [Kitasatospora indigofera]